MKLKCERAALYEAVQFAGALASTKMAKPILQNVKMVAEKKQLDVMATDLEVSIRFRLANVEIGRAGSVAVSAARLLGILRESPDEQMDIEAGDNKCTLRGADSRFEMLGDDPGDFPEIPEITAVSQIEVRQADFVEMVDKTVFAAASESTRYALNGVCFVFGANHIEVVATDGRRLAYIKRKAKGVSSEMGSIIVPRKALQHVRRLLTEEDKSVGMNVNENRIILQTSRALVSSVLVEGHFPPYKEVIPKDSDKKATLKREAFLGAIRRAALLTTEEARSVRMDFSKDLVVLTSEAPEAGKAEVKLGLEYEGDKVSIAFNPNFITDVLRVIESEDVVVEMKDATRPAVIHDGSDYIYVVMPINILGE
ncbi:MAG TPA: DNA polymerase III subunit beta [Planctomycetota bacterium]|nr:DNA polymerase III subunit beta [Planctomycetota bacterium]